MTCCVWCVEQDVEIITHSVTSSESHLFVLHGICVWWYCLFVAGAEKKMRLAGNWLLAERLVTTTLYKLLRLMFITVQRIYWQLNGTAQKLREARLPQNYERSAQVIDVVLFYKFCPGQSITIDNFLCTHNRFENPQYIIDNEHVTLMTINEHDAVFCEAKEKGKHIHMSCTHMNLQL